MKIAKDDISSSSTLALNEVRISLKLMYEVEAKVRVRAPLPRQAAAVVYYYLRWLSVYSVDIPLQHTVGGHKPFGSPRHGKHMLGSGPAPEPSLGDILHI